MQRPSANGLGPETALCCKWRSVVVWSEICCLGAGLFAARPAQDDEFAVESFDSAGPSKKARGKDGPKNFPRYLQLSTAICCASDVPRVPCSGDCAQGKGKDEKDSSHTLADVKSRVKQSVPQVVVALLPLAH